MKFSFLLLIGLIANTSFCQTTDDTAIEADEVIKTLPLGHPDEPLIRFGKDKINLFGKWCHITIDSANWTISKIGDGSLVYNCNGIQFDYYGKAEEYVWGDFFSKRSTIEYSIKDSILELIIRQNDNSTINTQYVIAEWKEKKVRFKKVYDSSDDPIIQKAEANNTRSRTDSIQQLITNSSGFGLYAPIFGQFFPIGESGQKISQGTNFNPGLLINLKKIRLMLSYSQLTGTIKDSFNYRQEYLIGREIQTISYELCGGYALGQKKYFKIIPMLGIGMTHHEVIIPDTFVPSPKTATYFTCSFRTAVDFSILKGYISTATNKKTGVGQIIIRTMLGYYPFLYEKPFKISDGTPFVSIGGILQFGWFPRQQKK